MFSSELPDPVNGPCAMCHLHDIFTYFWGAGEALNWVELVTCMADQNGDT